MSELFSWCNPIDKTIFTKNHIKPIHHILFWGSQIQHHHWIWFSSLPESSCSNPLWTHQSTYGPRESGWNGKIPMVQWLPLKPGCLVTSNHIKPMVWKCWGLLFRWFVSWFSRLSKDLDLSWLVICCSQYVGSWKGNYLKHRFLRFTNQALKTIQHLSFPSREEFVTAKCKWTSVPPTNLSL